MSLPRAAVAPLLRDPALPLAWPHRMALWAWHTAADATGYAKVSGAAMARAIEAAAAEHDNPAQTAARYPSAFTEEGARAVLRDLTDCGWLTRDHPPKGRGITYGLPDAWPAAGAPGPTPIERLAARDDEARYMARWKRTWTEARRADAAARGAPDSGLATVTWLGDRLRPDPRAWPPTAQRPPR